MRLKSSAAPATVTGEFASTMPLKKFGKVGCISDDPEARKPA
jgi:hypothetical protein